MLRRKKTTETPVTHGSTAASAADAPRAEAPAQRSAAPSDRAQGKKGPTPRRKDQERARRKTLVPEDRKAARAAERQALAEERTRQRAALESGDERHLPARDKGPQRRWVRDFVDARTGLGEWLMPIVLVYLVLMFVPGRQFQIIVMISLYVVVGLIVVESILLGRRIKRGLIARFGTPEPGTSFYGVMRALQFRRLRLPKPQVARGAHPA